MHRNVIDSHRVVWKRLIEVASVEQTATGHHGVVVAVADQQFALFQLSLGGARLQGGEDAWHILTGAGGRGIELALVRHQQGVDVVAVAIDESRQEGLALEVDDPCGRRPARQAPIPGPGEHNPAVLHAQRLDIARTLSGHGEDRAVDVEPLQGPGRQRQKRYQAGGEGSCAERNGFHGDVVFVRCWSRGCCAAP